MNRCSLSSAVGLSSFALSVRLVVKDEQDSDAPKLKGVLTFSSSLRSVPPHAPCRLVGAYDDRFSGSLQKPTL